MTSKEKTIALLIAYPKKKRQIEQLRHELADPPRISDNGMIESLAVGSPVIGGGKTGRISDKTMMIAMQYQDVAKKLNTETAAQIKGELQTLVEDTERLELYISLLSKRQALIIQRRYFEGRPWDNIEAELFLSKGTLSVERGKALDALASMYRFIEGFSGDSPGGAETK